MKLRYLISAFTLFLTLCFLSVWLCAILLGKRQAADDIIQPPPLVSEIPQLPSVPAGISDMIPPSSESSMPESFDPTPLPAEYAEPADDADLVTDIGFEISSTETYPGEYIMVYAYGDIAAAEISVNCPFSRDPVFFEQGERLVALLPIKFTYEPGEYMLTLTAGNRTENFTIHLLSKEWQTQNLTVSGEVVEQTIESISANEEYNDKVAPKKSLFEAAPLWDGSFIQPVAGRITTEFGMLRTVNGVPSDRHGGVDIAAPRGTPVAAANGGKVIFAEYIALTGNTVCIEHGMGLKSWYYHMDSLAVAQDDIVLKGQKIGEVGSTGFSTGPHLHWATSVFNVYVNPWSLVEAAPEI